MKIKLNKYEFDLDKDNKAFLDYILKMGLLRCSNNEEREILTKILLKNEYIKKNHTYAVVLCKKCKQRYSSFTDNEWLHCKCNNVYWKSDGIRLRIAKMSSNYEILLLSPEYNVKNSDASAE